MKKLLLAAGLVLGLASQSLAQQLVQATIKPSATPSAVDVYIRPNFTANLTLKNVQIAIGLSGIPKDATTGPKNVAITAVGNPTANGNFTSQPQNTNFNSSAATGGAYPEILYNAFTEGSLTLGVTNEAGTLNFLFNFQGVAASPTSFTAGVEMRVLTVRFLNTGRTGVNYQSLVSLANGGTQGGGGSPTQNIAGQMFFYIEKDATSGGDITNELQPFYTSPGVSLATNNGGGYSTYSKVTLVQSNPLPLQLLSFTATKAGAQLGQLDWVTTQEKDVDHYEIERSADSRNFSTVLGKVAAQNNSDKFTYTLMDKTPLSGDNYYRLKSVDRSGEVKYSEVRKLNFDRSLNGIVVKKNPFMESTEIKVTAEAAQSASYSVLDATGRVVMYGKWDVAAGENNYQLDLQGFASGTYTLTVKGTSVEGQAKLMKVE